MIPTLVATRRRTACRSAPAITWEDAGAPTPEATRCAPACGGERALRARPASGSTDATCCPCSARIAASRRGGADAHAACSAPRTGLFARLTGELATDPSTASGFGCYGLEAGAWLDAVVTAAGGLLGDSPAVAAPAGRSGLPACRRCCPRSPCGVLADRRRAAARPARRSAGLPRRRRLGAGLPWAGRRAAGRRRLRRPAPAPSCWVSPTVSSLDPAHRYLITPLAGLEGWGFEMDLLTTGSALSLAGRPAARRPAATRPPSWPLAAGVGARRGRPVALPYLAPGEQGALWDPTFPERSSA